MNNFLKKLNIYSTALSLLMVATLAGCSATPPKPRPQIPEGITFNVPVKKVQSELINFYMTKMEVKWNIIEHSEHILKFDRRNDNVMANVLFSCTYCPAPRVQTTYNFVEMDGVVTVYVVPVSITGNAYGKTETHNHDNYDLRQRLLDIKSRIDVPEVAEVHSETE